MTTYTIPEACKAALRLHPDCEYAEAYNGLDGFFRCTWVVKLWRNKECYLNDDPPKYAEEGFVANLKARAAVEETK